jgi:hypothetical protein
VKKLIVLVAVIVLSGCAQQPLPAPPTAPTPTPSVTPSLEPGIAIPGAFCRGEGAKRLTKTGATATCANNGERLQWSVAR